LLKFSINKTPRWATFDVTSGTLSGTPASSDIGIYSNIVIRVSDGRNTSSLSPFSINVSALQLDSLIGFSDTSITVNEGNAVKVEITRSNGAGEASVTYGTRGITAVSSTVGGDDYAGFSPTVVNFAKGETSKVVSVATLDNTEVESAETFELFLKSPSNGYELNNNSVLTVEIVDDDVESNASPTISGNPATQITENSVYSFTPSASDPDGDKLTFSINKKPDWATFDRTSGTLTGTPDSSDIGLYSNIKISVSDGTNTASLAAFSINVGALQLDSLVGFSNTSATVNEGDTVNVTITRSHGTDEASVTYGTRGITAVSSTVGGDDYTGFAPTVVNFAKGETSKVVSVETLDNTEAESTETLELFLKSPSTGYELDTNSILTITIVDNDNDDDDEQTYGSITLSWMPPSTREDGTSLSPSEIGGYRIYMGDSEVTLSPVEDINDYSVTEYTLTNIATGSHYYSVTTYDQDGNESDFSNIIEMTTK
jgi:hypothetical protein